LKLKVFIFFLLIFNTALASSEGGLMSERQERIERVFNDLRVDNLSILDDFYHPDIAFHDPVGNLKGLKDMKSYYVGMYENVKDIRFDFSDHVIQENTFSSFWDMTFQAEGLNSGEPITIQGISRIEFDPDTDLVIYHRDYFDMGSMVYEHIPVIGAMIRYIKGRFEHK